MGVSWELFGASRSTKEGLQIRLGIILGFVCSLLAAEYGLESLLGRLWLVSGAPASVLGGLGIRQADLTIKTALLSFDTLFLSCF